MTSYFQDDVCPPLAEAADAGYPCLCAQ